MRSTSKSRMNTTGSLAISSPRSKAGVGRAAIPVPSAPPLPESRTPSVHVVYVGLISARLAATADGKRRSPRQHERIDVARLLDVAEPDRQADIRRRLEFDARMRAIAWQCAGHAVEGGKAATDAGFVIQGVETGIDRDG